MRPGAFADADLLCVLADQAADVVRHQRVIKHNVGGLNGLQSMQGEQPGIARPRTRQHHLAACRDEAVELGGEFAFRCVIALLRHQRVKAAGKKLLPEGAAGGSGQLALHQGATTSGDFRQLAGVCRNQRLDALPPVAGKHRRRARTANGDLQRRAVNHGGDDVRTQRRTVHHIAQLPRRFRRLKYLRVQRVIIGSGDGEKHAVKLGGGKIRTDMFHLPGGKPVLKRCGQVTRDHAQAGASVQQRFCLARSDLPGADEQHRPPAQVGK